jgi:hypothetical protein
VLLSRLKSTGARGEHCIKSMQKATKRPQCHEASPFMETEDVVEEVWQLFGRALLRLKR